MGESYKAGQDDWTKWYPDKLLLPGIQPEDSIKVNHPKTDLENAFFIDEQAQKSGYFEARKTKWAVGIDAIYMALGTTVDQPPVDVDFNQGAYTFTGLRQLNDKVDFVFGARWNVLQGKL